MSTNINTTQQQDRVAQKHLANARQQAQVSGAQLGTRGGQAFAQLLSLACDEDTDLDAKRSSGGATDLAALEGDSEPAQGAKSRRKSAGSGDTTSDNPLADTLHPSAQGNAALLALLDRAEMGELAVAGDEKTADRTAAGPGADAALPGEQPLGKYAAKVGSERVSDAVTLPVDSNHFGTTRAEEAPQPAPGKAVRELARQLSAQRQNQELAQTSALSQAAPDTAHGIGTPWGSSASDTGSAAKASAWTQSAQLVSSPASSTSSSSSHLSHAGQPGSRSQNEFSAASSDGALQDAATATGDRPMATRTSADPGGQSQTGLGGEALAGTDHTETTPTLDALESPGEQWQQQWTDAMEQVAQQVSYWAGGGGVRQATLRVGSGQQQAIDVKLSLKNGQAEIEFRTDHEDARAAITQGGAEVLRNLLAGSGIDLGTVTVGGHRADAQGQQSAPGSSSPQPHPPPGRGHAASGSEALLPALNELRPRSASSLGLDVYV